MKNQTYLSMHYEILAHWYIFVFVLVNLSQKLLSKLSQNLSKKGKSVLVLYTILLRLFALTKIKVNSFDDFNKSTHALIKPTAHIT